MLSELLDLLENLYTREVELDSCSLILWVFLICPFKYIHKDVEIHTVYVLLYCLFFLMQYCTDA